MAAPTFNAIGYARTGHEFDVEEALQAVGICALVPRRVEAKRVPTKRMPVAVEAPFLPNYLFVSANPEQWPLLAGIKFLSPTVFRVGRLEAERSIPAFIDAVEAKFADRKARLERGERIESFEPGETIEVVAGPLLGHLAVYRTIVERARDDFPRLVADLTIFGRTTIVDLDPRDVRRIA